MPHLMMRQHHIIGPISPCANRAHVEKELPTALSVAVRTKDVSSGGSHVAVIHLVIHLTRRNMPNASLKKTILAQILTATSVADTQTALPVRDSSPGRTHRVSR